MFIRRCGEEQDNNKFCDKLERLLGDEAFSLVIFDDQEDQDAGVWEIIFWNHKTTLFGSNALWDVFFLRIPVAVCGSGWIGKENALVRPGDPGPAGDLGRGPCAAQSQELYEKQAHIQIYFQENVGTGFQQNGRAVPLACEKTQGSVLLW